MKDANSKAGIGFLWGVVSVMVVLGIGALIVVYSGAFNVAATQEHTALSRWALETSMQKSIERRAAGMKVPGVATQAMSEAGAGDYKAMCEHCHGGPGAERASWASGLRPRPPHLTEAASEWAPNEVFWLLKHGVRMSGMPAFGPSHDDETLWNITAFVKQLPAMTPEKYSELGGHAEHGSSGSAHSHGSD